MVILFGAAGCSSSAETPAPAIPDTITVTSPAFVDGDNIPAEFTCDGPYFSPPLAWSGVPAEATAIALVISSPDAADRPITNWIVTQIDPSIAEIAQGELPSGADESTNDSGGAAYSPICSAARTESFEFTVYALSEDVAIDSEDSAVEAVAIIEDAAIASGRLTATSGN